MPGLFVLVPKEKRQLPFLTNVLSRQHITKPNQMQNKLRKTLLQESSRAVADVSGRQNDQIRQNQ